MERMEWIAPCHFGLESVLKREIQDLGYEIAQVEDGRVTFYGGADAACRANVFLRTAERVLLKAGSFKAVTFDELFEKTKAIPWENYIPKNGKFWVAKASSVKSKLFSPSDIQSIMKKAMVDRLRSRYHVQWFQEDGASYPLRVFLMKDIVTIGIDTSGDSLHKRGYRPSAGKAPISETLADKAKELGVVEGVWVSEIVENGSAAGADIKVDDVIIGVDNKKVSNMADLQEALAKHRPGDKVKVKLMRDKKEKTVEVTLKNEQGTTKIVKDAGMEILGAAFKELPDDLKKQLNLGYGLQVTGVSSGKMSDAGVRKGFIILKANDQPMRKVSDLEEVMKAAVKSPNQVLFLTGVFPSGKRGYFAVDLTQE